MEKKRLREEEKRKRREEEKCKRKEADKQKKTAEKEVRIKVIYRRPFNVRTELNCRSPACIELGE